MTTPTPLKALSSGPSHLAVRRHIFVSLTFCVSVHGEIVCSAAAAKLLQSCPTLCDSRDGSPRGSPWDSPGKNTGVGCHFLLQCMKAKSESEVAWSCPTPSDPMDCSLPGSSVHGIFQARVLELVAIAFSITRELLLLSRFSRVRLCATPETAAHQVLPVPGILQARTLEWVAISFSNA